ncbi:aldehyde dehydrogenase (NADP(+)) [Amycolatopsis jiangsuensis]|uniref:NADP-dependent aldehyde dehydrogenase n=1 Tax=Amycolatopsis jiangsuensis TaxID=1181879 RepID=A0A840IPY1_9PSEU|nr:aldehyde dehydrogenase (NADP(+)) [Amycolatopsis jiangsuensis]MBB4683515.1 NADP-dependent aldehyde dehydrogenase [Amycolatopsis jiangsuensis]
MSTASEVDSAARSAAAAARWAEDLPRTRRAGLLEAMAAELEADAEAIVADADRETSLGEPRLRGELNRTTYQLRLFAETVRDGGYLEATVDHAGDTPMGPRPDLRRMLVPLGPVAVFGASNFPLAFSVPGGDTAAALAAGCPVVIKAHPAHPDTSQRCFDALSRAAKANGAPDGLLGLVSGQQAGVDLITHPAIKAAAFTGSPAGGRVLGELAANRPEPIPFYGELGSINPVVVTAAAAAERAAELGTGLAGSALLGAGQFCTKPGLVFLPDSEAGQQIADGMAAEFAARPEHAMLTAGIREAFDRRAGELAAQGVTELMHAPGGRLFSVAAAEFTEPVADECFGPSTVLVRYPDEAGLDAALAKVPGSLTATLHTGQSEDVRELTRRLRERAGRVLFNGYPTGVAVSWAQHHGGPWPSTTSALHTSVGMTAPRRFLRPVTWQDAPEAVLPEELRESPAEEFLVPRRVDGRWLPRG